MTPHDLSAIFRSGDLPFRPRYIAQHFVVQRVKDDPLRAVLVYRDLLRTGGTNHAAEKFLGLLEQARTRNPWVVWMWNVVEHRPTPRPIPG